jgi:hypothetical protein
MNTVAPINPAIAASIAPHVYRAIQCVMHDIGEIGISKDRKNVQQGYKFRGIDDVYNALNPLLSKHGLVVLPRILNSHQVERQSKSGGAIFYTTLTVEFKAVSTIDGSFDTLTTVGEAMDSADKSSNKAMAAAFKYAAMMLFCIPTEGDNEADATTHDQVQPQTKTASQTATKGQSREPYEKISAGIKAIEQTGTREDLKSWWKSHVKTIEAFSPDWNAAIMAEFTSARDAIDAKEIFP